MASSESADGRVAGPARAAAALGLALALWGCAPPPVATAPGAPVRVCDEAGCRVQPNTLQTAQIGDPAAVRQEDPDAYRGEPVAELRAAAAGGDPRAAYRLGQAYEAGAGGLRRSPAEAARLYGTAAEAGLPFARYRLGRLAARGEAPGGRGRAVELYNAAAADGVAQAAHDLGVMALEGRGLPRDPAEAARWFTRGAEGGVPESQYNLALMLFRGEGVPRQPYQALQWMRRAGSAGLLPAQRALGRVYMTGLEEMGQDLQEARTWLSLAAGRGDAEARRLLPQVERALEQDAAARRAFERQLALEAERTRALWASVALASLLTPPLLVVVPGYY